MLDGAQVVLEVARGDEGTHGLREERGRPLLRGGLDAAKRGVVARRRIRCDDVEQQHGHSRIREMRGNPRTHGARAQHSHTSYGPHRRSPIGV